MREEPRAFVIMPFDQEFNSIYETLIKEPLVEAGYEVSRADSFLNQQNILSEIVRGITTADLLVADLTTNNPNVFYELGLAHGLGIPTVLIAQSINDVPFDLRSYKIHIYDTHFNKIKTLKEFLKKVGEKSKRREISFGNPVFDFSEKGTSHGRTLRTALSDGEGESELPGDVEEKGLLDYLVDGEEAAHSLTTTLAKLLKDNQLVTDRITRHAASIEALRKDPTAGSARMFHKIALLAASDINRFSNKVQDTLPVFEKAVDRMGENYSGYLRTVTLETEEDKEVLRRLRTSIEGLLQNSRAAKTAMQSYLEATIELGERKISKDLSRASRKQADAINGLISNLEKVEAFTFKALLLINERAGTTLDGPPRLQREDPTA